MSRVLALSLTFVLSAGTALAAEAPTSEPNQESQPILDLAIIFSEDAHGARPRDLLWTPDGVRLLYRFDDGSGEALHLFDARTGETSVVVPAELLSQLEESGEDEDGISTPIWSPDGDALLMVASGDLWLWELGGEEWRRLTQTAVEEKDPKFAPNGSAVGFVREADLWLLELASGKTRALTTDGKPDLILNGTTDWVYWEEIYGRHGTGFWWGPESKRIAYYQFDESAVETYPLTDLLEPYPEVTWQKYPVTGSTNPTVRVGILSLEEDETVWLDTGSGAEVYLARVDWTPESETVMVQRVNRDQDELDLLRCDPDTGNCEEILRETWPTWVNLSNDYRFLGDGRFIWPSERSGWQQLYLYDQDGKQLAQITHAEGAVDTLVAVNEEKGILLYSSFGAPPLGAMGRQVWRVDLDGGEARLLAGKKGWNEANAGSGGRYWVHSWSDANHPPKLVVRNAEGEVVAPLPARSSEYDPAALPQWEFFTLENGKGHPLPAQMLRPAGFDPAGRYPVLMYHYGGPGSQVVANRWSRTRGLWHKMMAARGYVVLKVDNPASTYFGKRGEDLEFRRFGEVNLAAQTAAAAWLEQQPWADVDHLGIWGWSGGGTNTLYLMTHTSGIWEAGMAGAPVTDWHYYDTIWTERYLDHPAKNEEGYRLSSPLTSAAELSGQLLIVHGTADDNVHPANTFAFVDALIQAGLSFQMAIYPKQMHHFDKDYQRHFYERMTSFFERMLRAEGATHFDRRPETPSP